MKDDFDVRFAARRRIEGA
jgi:hypothetical protein